MILRLHVPSPLLSEYIEMLTYYEDYSPGHSIERLLPEGVVEIIIDMTEDPKYIYDNHTLATIQSCRRSWISGMRSRYISISVVRRSAMFVIRFRRGKQKGNYSLFSIRPDGSGLTQITPDDFNEGWHTWSPDGALLSYDGSDLENKKFSIYLADTNGKNPRQLTNEFKYEQAPIFVQRKQK